MPRRAKADRRIGALALFALGAIGLVAWRGESSALLSGRSSVGRSAFGSRATRQSLESLGALHVVPPRNDQEIADPRYAATPPTARAVAEALAIGELQLASGRPILGLRLRAADLARMDLDPEARGRTSEVPGYMAFFEHGELRFATGVGVRPHGGISRRRASSRGYRLIFRKAYGLERPPISPFPNSQIAGLRPRRWVVRHDHPRPYVPALALDVARRIGVPTPEMRPVVLVVNGTTRVEMLTEQVRSDFLRARFGASRFALFDSQTGEFEGEAAVASESLARAAELERWLATADLGDLEQVARQVDVEQLARWFVAVLLAAAEDVDQGYMALDLDRPGARWFWIAWDLDVSFRTHEERRGWWKPRGRAVGKSALDPRRVLIGRLLSGSPDFRRLVRRTLAEAESSLRQDDFLAARWAEYEGWAAEFGDLSPEACAEVARFLLDHPAAVRGSLAPLYAEESTFSEVTR